MKPATVLVIGGPLVVGSGLEAIRSKAGLASKRPSPGHQEEGPGDCRARLATTVLDAAGTQRSVRQVTWRCVVQTLPRQHRRLKDHFFVGTFQSLELTDTEVTSLVVDDIHRVTDGQSLQVVDFGFVKIIQQFRNDCDRSSCYCEYDTQLTHAQLPMPICSHTTHLTIEFYFIRSSCCYNIYIISISIPSPPLFHSRLKTLLFCKSFTPLASLSVSSSGLTPRIPRTVNRPILLSMSVFYFFVFFVFPLFSCWFRAVDEADSCQLMIAR